MLNRAYRSVEFRLPMAELLQDETNLSPPSFLTLTTAPGWEEFVVF